MAAVRPSPRSKRVSSKGAKTRSAIMAAGAELFATRGYRATGIRDIAEKVGVNVALISYHFGGKGPLYDAILAEGVEAAQKAIDQSEQDVEAAPEERLVRVFAEAMTSRPNLGAMILREQLDPDRLLEPKTASTLMGFMQLTKKMLASLPLDDEARDWDPQIIHLCIVGPLIHYLVSTRMREAVAPKLDGEVTTPSLDEFVEVQAAMLRRALRHPPP